MSSKKSKSKTKTPMLPDGESSQHLPTATAKGVDSWQSPPMRPQESEQKKSPLPPLKACDRLEWLLNTFHTNGQTCDAHTAIEATFRGEDIYYSSHIQPQPTAMRSFPQPTATRSFAQPTASTSFAQPTASTSFAQPTASTSFAQPTASTSFAQPIAMRSFAQPIATRSFAQPIATRSFTQQESPTCSCCSVIKHTKNCS